MNRHAHSGRIARAALLSLALIAASPAARADATSPAPVAALYETRVVPKRHGAKAVVTRWYFWRDAGQVEIRDEDGRMGERWERDPSGKLFYTRLFHRDRAQIEFAPTEFQVVGKSWGKVSMLIEPDSLGTSLKMSGSERRAGQSLVRYSGSADGQRIDLRWRADLALPAEIRGDDAQKTTTVRLVRNWPLAHAPQSMTDTAVLAAYRTIDGADLGDMESDPFVTRMLGQGGHEHAH